jgi:CubicO group peptidase (beta-lactamase class C family)
VPNGIRQFTGLAKHLAIVASLTGAGMFAQDISTESRRDARRRLADVVRPYVEDHAIAGAVILAADRDRVIDRDAIGYADIANRRVMKPDDMFWVASMTKAITAAAVMMLVDEGKVQLDDPVEKYLPEFKGQMVDTTDDTLVHHAKSFSSSSSEKTIAPYKLEATKHPITVREILSHTSGLPFSSKREPGALDLLPLKSAVESYSAEPLESQPGQKYSYSNEGFNTVGRIIEVINGISFEEFLQKQLFDPLGMKDTTFLPTREQLNRLAKSYEPDSAKKSLREVPISQLTYPLDDRRRRFPIPAGGLFSTADNMALFCQMMLNHGTFRGRRYLSEESVRLITTKQTGSSVEKQYGFGWNVGDGTYEHSGAYRTDMKVDEKRGLVIIFLVQRAVKWSGEDEGERIINSIERAETAGQIKQVDKKAVH